LKANSFQGLFADHQRVRNVTAKAPHSNPSEWIVRGIVTHNLGGPGMSAAFG
jgi:hypothetical protein